MMSCDIVGYADEVLRILRKGYEWESKEVHISNKVLLKYVEEDSA